MTKMLYRQDSYQREHQSRVVRVQGNNVVLDETVFFPVTSTEPGDTGAIDSYRVVRVERDAKKDEIRHMLEGTPDLRTGQVVTSKVDWEKRYKMMRLHSALHLLAGCFDLLFRQRAVAGVVESDDAFLVFKQPVDEFVTDAVAQANDDIEDGMDITTYEDEKRKGFRWCKVGNYLPIPCGGVHVRNTSEIGKVVIKEKRIEAGSQRLVLGVD